MLHLAPLQVVRRNRALLFGGMTDPQYAFDLDLFRQPQQFLQVDLAGLPHPLFQMRKVQIRMIGCIPDKIVPITPFHAVFPFAEKERMCLLSIGMKYRPATAPNGDLSVSDISHG